MNTVKSKIKALLPIVFLLIIGVAIVSAETALPVYRFYNDNNGDHFYTMNNAEKDSAIKNPSFVDEGIAFYAYPNQIQGTIPVYRFWSTIGGHFYTMKESEKNKLINGYSNSYVFEGIAFYAYPNQTEDTLPVYRFYNDKQGGHFYTISETEKNKVTTNPSFTKYWISEGIAFYAFATQISTNQTTTNQTNQTTTNQTNQTTTNQTNQTTTNQTNITQKVSNLKVEDKTKNSITWKWTNPSTNFTGIAVYINGKNIINISKYENSYKAEGLESGKAYTITLKIIFNGQISAEGVSSSTYTDDAITNSVVVSSNRASVTSDDTPIVFTSYSPQATPIALSNTNQKTVESAQGFKLTTIHYILIILIILSIIVLIFIFKNL